MESPFRQPVDAGLELFETFRWTPGAGALRGEMHLARMARSAAALGFAHDATAARAAVDGITADAPLRVRLAQDAGGRVALKTAPFTPVQGDWQLAISDTPIRSDDPYRGVKTTRRAEYDAARAALPDGCDEVIFLNERGEVAEGAIANIFVAGADRLITPPLRAGCLPGILRAQLLAEGRAVEGALRPGDLVEARVFVGNSLRGLICAHLPG